MAQELMTQEDNITTEELLHRSGEWRCARVAGMMRVFGSRRPVTVT